jgi:ribosome maturation factor RimP
VGFGPLFIFLASVMAGSGNTGERVEQIAASVAEKAGIEFVHCEIAGTRRNPTFRLIIDKPGGVTLEDCADISRAVEAVLDNEDFIPTSYVLEVSSPGIERELYRLADFEKFTGKGVRLKTTRPIGGQRNFAGTITAVTGNEIDFEDKTKGRMRIPFDSIDKATLTVDLTEDFKKG